MYTIRLMQYVTQKALLKHSWLQWLNYSYIKAIIITQPCSSLKGNSTETQSMHSVQFKHTHFVVSCTCVYRLEWFASYIYIAWKL